MNAAKLAGHGMVLSKFGVAVHVGIMRRTLRETRARFAAYSRETRPDRYSAQINPDETDEGVSAVRASERNMGSYRFKSTNAVHQPSQCA
jgi:hypothetical protein